MWIQTLNSAASPHHWSSDQSVSICSLRFSPWTFVHCSPGWPSITSCPCVRSNIIWWSSGFLPPWTLSHFPYIRKVNMLDLWIGRVQCLRRQKELNGPFLVKLINPKTQGFQVSEGDINQNRKTWKVKEAQEEKALLSWAWVWMKFFISQGF